MNEIKMEEDFLYYMVDVDIYAKDYGVIETVESDLFRSKSIEQITKFAKKYAKERNNFDFDYLRNSDGDYYLVTIRKYYKEETEEENGNWDDWDIIRVVTPRK